MGFVLDPNKNRGFPSLSELPDMNEISFHTKPYPESLMLQKTGEYPHVPILPDMEKIPIHTKPYSESLMLQKPDEYPYAPILPRNLTVSLTRCFSAERAVKGLYFGDKKVIEAFFNGDCVFSEQHLD